MGNPAGDKRKLKEKRRMRQELRLGPGAYLPKEQRAQLQAEIKKGEEVVKAANEAKAKTKAAAKPAAK
jgi:hypothetical protein